MTERRFCFEYPEKQIVLREPCLVVAFKDHDTIVACFDDESQHMLEVSAEPTLGVVFSPQKLEKVMNAIRIVRRFVALNFELFESVEELKKLC